MKDVIFHLYIKILSFLNIIFNCVLAVYFSIFCYLLFISCGDHVPIFMFVHRSLSNYLHWKIFYLVFEHKLENYHSMSCWFSASEFKSWIKLPDCLSMFSSDGSGLEVLIIVYLLDLWHARREKERRWWNWSGNTKLTIFTNFLNSHKLSTM